MSTPLSKVAKANTVKALMLKSRRRSFSLAWLFCQTFKTESLSYVVLYVGLGGFILSNGLRCFTMLSFLPFKLGRNADKANLCLLSSSYDAP